MLTGNALFPRDKQMIREKSLQIIEVELDRSLSLQIGIILDHIAFIHAVYHLDRIPAQLDTEDLDPEKWLYRQLESAILDHLHIHPRAHLLTGDIQIHVQPGRQGTELEGLILHRLEELIMSLHASGFHRPDFLGRFTACQHRK